MLLNSNGPRASPKKCIICIDVYGDNVTVAAVTGDVTGGWVCGAVTLVLAASDED